MTGRVLAMFLAVGMIASSCATGSVGDTAETTTTTVSPSTTPAPVPTTLLRETTTTEEPASSTTTSLVAVGSVCGEVDAGADQPTETGSERIDARGVAQVWVPEGSFTMGTEDPSNLEVPSFAISEVLGEQPAHDVTISVGFWIDKFEVTNESFGSFSEMGGYDDPACWSEKGWEWREKQRALPVDCETDDPDHPRACVSWFEAEAYATWRGGELPSEAQWEYAARGPDSLIYPWGDEWDPALANVVDATGTTPVGSFPAGASWVGALDMSGNVMEWVADWLSFSYYAESPEVDPEGPDVGSIKVEKGGWWGSLPYVARAAYRHFEDPPRYQDKHIGLRVVHSG
ncbi:MAG: SUMF1/EgtB/PvdO family nonheme iron enzyme [Acidimicrobiia bacterium]|nr:SUMF1/EgtB/PvdO family nonheme iron enzyme [Acidimicrobiia bacterium]